MTDALPKRAPTLALAPTHLNRRDVLRAGLRTGLMLAAAPLAACGGGGGDPGPGRPGETLSGRLVYRNSGRVGVLNFATGAELTFDPGIEPFIDPGVSVSAAGVIAVARERDNSGFPFALYRLDGSLIDVFEFRRPFAFQTSAAMFNADATRLAISLDEPVSDLDNTRIARTLVVDWPGGALLATFDGAEEPVWAGRSGDLILRDPGSGALFVTGPALGAPRALGLNVTRLIGGYSVAPDGETVVHDDGDRVLAFNRRTGASWVAARHATSSTHAPVVSPDGRYLALLARANQVYVPHVVPFEPGLTVVVTAAANGLSTQLVDCAGRIGWTA